METSTEEILSKVKQTRNVANARGKLTATAIRFGRQHELQAMRSEKADIDKSLQRPDWAAQTLTRSEKDELVDRSSTIDDTLETVSPPKLSGAAKDALNIRRKALEDSIRVGMLSEEEMRHNPPDAVDRNIAWEKAHKDEVLEWKNIKVALDPESEAESNTNIETIRPRQFLGDGSVPYFNPNAQIPGHFAMTQAAKDRWPLGEPKMDTVLKQAERQEASSKSPDKTDTLKEAAKLNV